MQDRSHSPTPPEPGATHEAEGGAAERRELFADFVSAGELERRRVAESIHDDSIQVIAAMGMRLQMLRRAIDDPEQVGMLADAEQAVQLSIARLRHLVYELHPPGLEQEGLAVALALALDSSRRDSAIEYQLVDQLESRPPHTAVGDPLPHRAGGARERARARGRRERHRDAAGARRRPRGAHRRRRLRLRGGARAARGDRATGSRACARACGSAAAACASSRRPAPGTTVEAWLPRWQALRSNGGAA